MALCKLCLRDTNLVESHIIPEFMYKPLYDKEHRFNIVGTNAIIKKRPTKGIYEKLFCKDCDNKIIGKYENHASSVIFGDGKKEIKIVKTRRGIFVYGIDYKLFKLFQISLLWRCAISNRSEIGKIELGFHQEIMRKMLLNENPYEYFRYGVLMCFFPQSSRKMFDLIITPEEISKLIDGHKIYRAVFNGICWIFVMSEPTKIFENRKYFLSPEGKLSILDSGTLGERFANQLISDLIGEKNIYDASSYQYPFFINGWDFLIFKKPV